MGEKGPWFIGGHFLSVRPWESFFKPATANVTSIAVWVRLHALPMELYETVVLKQIGDSIGKVLRIDSQTAMEARGKYARLCLQIDMNEPLINTVLIGRFEQPVTYEGIQKFCFSCGRIGHKKDVCSYTIRNPNSPSKGADGEHENQPISSREAHVTDSTVSGTGTSDGSGVDTNNESYGPWMILTRRKVGQRVSRSATVTEGPTGSVKKSLRHEVGQGISYNSSKMGWVKEPNTLLRVDAEPNGKFFQAGPCFVGHIANQNIVARTNIIESNTRTSPSVRGKKGIARNRASSFNSKAAADSSFNPTSVTTQAWTWKNADGAKGEASIPFQFAAPIQSEVGHQAWRKGSGDTGGGDCSNQRKTHAGIGLARQEFGRGVEIVSSDDGGKCEGASSSPCNQAQSNFQADLAIQHSLNSKRDDYGSFEALSDSMSRERADKRKS